MSSIKSKKERFQSQHDGQTVRALIASGLATQVDCAQHINVHPSVFSRMLNKPHWTAFHLHLLSTLLDQNLLEPYQMVPTTKAIHWMPENQVLIRMEVIEVEKENDNG